MAKASSPATQPTEEKMDRAEANGTDEAEEPLVRRSGRARKRRTAYRDDTDSGLDELAQSLPATPSPTKKRIRVAPRRNPQREAAAAVPAYSFPVPEPEEIQELAFAPLSREDLEAWRGWTDVESEPSFFNFIIHEMGIQDAKIHEIFAVDEMSFDLLPKPVYGLIFLYQFREEHDEDREDCPPDVWFANQTTADACATIAMLNIAMNSKGLHLDDHLQQFKAATQSLNPALRGYLLSTNNKIRTAHNSFARRMDVLNADLSLKNEVDDHPKKKSKASAKKSARKTKKADKDAAFHYVAYVPIKDKVWELDGLQQQPLCIGSCGSDWAAEARTRIEARIQEYVATDENAAFNLLAFCHSPLDGLRRELASNIRHLALLDANMTARDAAQWTAMLPPAAERNWLDGRDADTLAEHKLAEADLDRVVVPPEFVARVAKPSFGPSEALDLLQKLEADQARIRRDYVADQATWDDDVARVAGRKKDYTGALHAWAKKLAEKGLLKELKEQVD